MIDITPEMRQKWDDEAYKAKEKYDYDVKRLQYDFDYETRTMANLLPDKPLTEHFICGDGVKTHWQVDRKPRHIAGVKVPMGSDFQPHSSQRDNEIIIDPPIPYGVVVKVTYQFEMNS